MNDSCTTTLRLTELLDVLRSGLAALVPVVERASIPWTEGDAYDDWEAIASTLYEQIVVNTIRNAEEVADDLKLPKYDLVYPSYGSTAYIEVLGDGEVLGPFVGFEAIDPQFTKVKYAVSDAEGAVDTNMTRSFAFSGCAIRLRLPDAIGGHLEEVTIRE